jgi:hypothetical protein
MTTRRPRTEHELVEFVRAIDVPAPESLHRSVQSLIASHERRGARPARALAVLIGGLRSAPRFAMAAGALGAAVLVLVLVLALGSGTRTGPGLRETAALTLLPPSAPAPPESASRHAELAAAVDGVSFPYWQERLGWRSTGTRTDRVGGRVITTVFYASRRGGEVGYAIVGGLPAPEVSGGVVAWRGGTRYRLSHAGGAPVVTWLRGGHLCVVSGRRVSAATLLELASWHASVSA